MLASTALYLGQGITVVPSNVGWGNGKIVDGGSGKLVKGKTSALRLVLHSFFFCSAIIEARWIDGKTL